MNKIFTELPIPVDERVPEGYNLIVAYAKDDKVVIPINATELGENHNCDWEGCSSIEHVFGFSISDKYRIDKEK